MYELTDVPESWYVVGGIPGAVPAVPTGEGPGLAVPAVPASDDVPPVIVPVVLVGVPAVPVVTLGTPVGGVPGGGDTILGSGTVIGPNCMAFDKVNGPDGVAPGPTQPIIVMLCGAELIGAGG
jgi:hypothetical protein